VAGDYHELLIEIWGGVTMRQNHVRIGLAFAVLLLIHAGGSDVGTAQEKQIAFEVANCNILLSDERMLAVGQTGNIARIHVREGDRVQQGQLLAELDVSVPQAALAVAEKLAENDVDVRFAKVAAKVAEAEYALALAANEQTPETFSEIELEKLKLEQERSRLQIEVAQQEYDANQLRRDEARALVESYRLLAPAEGLISRVYKRPGAAVQSGEQLLEFKGTKTLRIEGDLPVRALGSVRTGAKVTVIPEEGHPPIPAGMSPHTGTLFFLDVSVNSSSKEARFLVEIENPKGLLWAGFNATVLIETNSQETDPATTTGLK
jgi:RND family efflux transporter MFP subunit